MIGRRAEGHEVHEDGRADSAALPQPSGETSKREAQPLEAVPLADLAEMRRASYRFLAELFLYPGGDRLTSAVRFAREMNRAGMPLRAFAFFGRWRHVLEALAALRPAQVPALQREFLGLFTLGAEDACFPYESSYVGREGLDTGRVAAEVQRAYTSAGLILDARGELPDHVSVELDFMSFLCAMEVPAWRRNPPRGAAEWLDREEGFLQDHLLRWLPAFAGRVEGKAPESFYRRLADAAHAFAAHDADLVVTLRALAASAAEGGRG